MDKLIERFVGQLEEALDISEKSIIREKMINKVLIIGMGGSGIAGSFVKSLMGKYGKVPVLTLNDYTVPKWVDEQTLIIASSYSGNTEETIGAVKELINTGIKIVSVTSGGSLYDISVENGFDIVRIPDNWPAPRACLGYSIVAQLSILNKLGLFELDYEKELLESIKLLKKESDSIKDEAKNISDRLIDKFPIIYSNSDFEPLAIRFKQQLNENSKMLAHHAIVPEMNHNELVGWASKYDNFAVIFIKSDLYSSRINARIQLSKEIILNHADTLIEIEAKGKSILEQFLYLVNLTDWISVYLAQSKGVDVMEIANINHLKEQLAKI